MTGHLLEKGAVSCLVQFSLGCLEYLAFLAKELLDCVPAFSLNHENVGQNNCAS